MDGYSTNDKGEQALLSEFSGPMRLGGHEAKVKISFSYLVAVKIKDETSAAESATPAAELTKANPPQPAASTTVRLLDGKLKIDIPSDFAREPDDPAHPKTLAKFSRKDGAWGEMLRSTHGLTPEKLDGYLKMRVEEYSKGSIGCQGFPPPMVAERNRGRRWPQIGGLALRSNVKGSEGLSAQSGLYAFPHHFLQRPTFRDHLHDQLEH